jgi:uncharacterized UPF0146 family protein
LPQPSPIPWSALPALPSSAVLPLTRIHPFPDKHFTRSRAMIAEVAAEVPPGGRAQVLGAGACRDIPVGVLAERFAEVVLSDIEEQRLREGVRAQKDIARPERVKLDVSDHSGVAAAFRPQAEAQMAGVRDARTAVGRLGELMDRTMSGPVDVAGVFELTVCSGVLSQVDFPLWKIAITLLESRFGKPFDKALTEQLRTHQRPMGHRFRIRLIDTLHASTRDGGRIYLADTIQVAHLESKAGEDWAVRGAYRMGLLPALTDYLDKRFIIDRRDGWDWVDLPDGSTDREDRGRLWRVEAAVLTRTPGKAALIV